VNSEFILNEGCFKVPLLFGGVNVSFDKFGRIEDQYKQDVDNWLCNLYFEIEKIKLSEIKVHPENRKLYYRFEKSMHEVKPTSQSSTQRQLRPETVDSDRNLVAVAGQIYRRA
jgi:hypothetical protein